jgi:hypothetical protein
VILEASCAVAAPQLIDIVTSAASMLFSRSSPFDWDNTAVNGA